MNPRRLHAYFEMLIVSIIWGVAAVVIKFTLAGFSPFVFLTYRFFLATLVAIGFFLIRGFKFPKNPKLLLITIFYGFLVSTVSLGLLFLGTDKTTSIDANLISAMAPITIVIAGAIFLKEHITKKEKIGIGIALIGTLITVLEPLLRFNDGSAGLQGNLLVLASVLVATITAVMAKVIMRDKVDPITITNISFVTGFLTTLPIVLLTTTPLELVSSIVRTPIHFHLGVVFMALVSGTLAYTLWHKAEKSIEISEVSIFAYLYPLFGTPLSVLWLGEKITTPFVVGAIVIAIGVIIAEYKKSRTALR